MKKLMLTAALLAGSAFAGEPAFELKGDAAKGESTYKNMCGSCHGEKGDGNGPAAAALTPKPSNFTDPAAKHLTDEWIYKMVKNGGAANGKSPLMVAWDGALKDQGVRDVAAYVAKFRPAPAAEPKKDGKKAGKK